MKPTRFKKYLCTTAVCLTALATLFSATGCSSTIKNRSDVLSDNLLSTCNEQIVEYNPDYKMEDFQIIGADINKTAFEFDVNFNGIASFSDNSVGYTSVNYNVPSTYFVDITKTSDTKDIYNVFDAIVKDLKPESISVSPVNDLVAVNDAFVKNEPAIFKNAGIRRALVFNLGTPEFNDEENTIDFDMKTLVETKKGNVEVGFGIGFGFGGGVGLGASLFFESNLEGTFVTTNNYKLTLDKETYEK